MISPKENSTRCMERSPRPKGIPVKGAKVRTQSRAAFTASLARVNEAARRSCYADDIIIHCRTEDHAQIMLRIIELRLARCKLKLHPQKTKIVYCKDYKRLGNCKHESFDFLGYGFRPRSCKGRTLFLGFTPAVSKSAIKAIRATIRGWKLHLWSSTSLEEIAKKINPVVRGWLNYYGRYRKSALYPILRQIEHALFRWAMRKYKKLRGYWLKATHWLGRIARREPGLFVSWGFGPRPSAG
jgi:RNA-directed DNA polymerase